jgi:Ca2+:H+ antiporter
MEPLPYLEVRYSLLAGTSQPRPSLYLSSYSHHTTGTSVLLLIVYGCYLFFQLKSHADMYNRPSQKVERRSAKVEEGDASRGIAQIGKMTATPLVGQNPDHMQMEDLDDEPEEPQLSITVAVLTLIISTAFVAACAEFMVCIFTFLRDQF